MRSFLSNTVLFFGALTLAFSAVLTHAETTHSFQILVNPENPVSSLNRIELSRLFLKKETSWPDRNPVQPVDLTRNSPVRAAFVKAVHGRTIAEIEAFWQHQIFSGRGVPPPELSSEEEVISFVKTHKGAIGYVSATTPIGDLRVVPLSD